MRILPRRIMRRSFPTSNTSSELSWLPQTDGGVLVEDSNALVASVFYRRLPENSSQTAVRANSFGGRSLSRQHLENVARVGSVAVVDVRIGVDDAAVPPDDGGCGHRGGPSARPATCGGT